MTSSLGILRCFILLLTLREPPFVAINRSDFGLPPKSLDTIAFTRYEIPWLSTYEFGRQKYLAGSEHIAHIQVTVNEQIRSIKSKSVQKINSLSLAKATVDEQFRLIRSKGLHGIEKINNLNISTAVVGEQIKSIKAKSLHGIHKITSLDLPTRAAVDEQLRSIKSKGLHEIQKIASLDLSKSCISIYGTRLVVCGEEVKAVYGSVEKWVRKQTRPGGPIQRGAQKGAIEGIVKGMIAVRWLEYLSGEDVRIFVGDLFEWASGELCLRLERATLVGYY